jgi:ribonuclease HII
MAGVSKAKQTAGKAKPTGLKLRLEAKLRRRGFSYVAGVDEVGRGPLAGPVTAAAVILDARNVPDGLADSKALAAELREGLYVEIASWAVAVGVGFATPREIDGINIRQATFLAMRRALAALPVAADYCLIDGVDLPTAWTGPGEAIVKGDATCASIAAASIVAKVMRDRLMVRQHRRDPRYGFDQHKGYATPDHREALVAHGPSSFHRLSFAPCGPTLFSAADVKV